VEENLVTQRKKTGSLVVLLLAQRAASEGPRWTRAFDERPGYPLKREMSELGRNIIAVLAEPPR
jgi:hypothetical protein